MSKTAIGRAWVRHQGMGESAITGRIIPATRRFPEPALALPVYDNNGKSAGLALVSLIASPEGRLTQGDTRMVVTARATGAVLQRSQSGNTIVVNDLTSGLDAVKAHPKDGVVWQTGTEAPRAGLLKITGGSVREEDQSLAKIISKKDADIVMPDAEMLRPKEEDAPHTGGIREQDNARQYAEEQLAVVTGKRDNETKAVPPEIIIIPPEEAIQIKTDVNGTGEKEGQAEPPANTIRQIAVADGQTEINTARILNHDNLTGPERGAADRASRVVNELASNERDIARTRQHDSAERGRTPERDEQNLTRTIQKER